MVDLPVGVPDNVREVFEHFGDVHIPEGRLDEAIRKIYELGNEGKCMLCEGELGGETIVKVNVVGIDQVYCSHRCDNDMVLLGYLSQQYDDVKERVDFRGGSGADEPAPE